MEKQLEKLRLKYPVQSPQKKILVIENAIKTIEKRIQKMEQLVK